MESQIFFASICFIYVCVYRYRWYRYLAKLHYLQCLPSRTQVRDEAAEIQNRQGH